MIIVHSIHQPLDLYFPFPWPDTGSIISACSKLEISLDAPELFNPKSSMTALLPNIPSKPNPSKSRCICAIVFAEKLPPITQKNTFNVHFLFVQKSTYVKIPVVELVFLAQKQISEKYLKIFCSFMDTSAASFSYQSRAAASSTCKSTV